MNIGALFYRLATEGWPARALKSAIGAAALPGDVYAGRTDPRSDEAIGRAFDLAGTLATGGMPLAKQGAAGIFGGRLAKTADLKALKEAERMAGRGADRAAIWNQTGWFQGADGKWRFEIPDDAMTVRFGEGMGVTCPQSKIQHNALAEAYPQMADTMHAINKGDLRGSHWAANPEVGDRTIFWVWGPGAQEAKSAATHELQHAVQRLEGFAGGGTPSQFESLLPSKVRATSGPSTGRHVRSLSPARGRGEARNVKARADYSPDAGLSYHRGPKTAEQLAA